MTSTFSMASSSSSESTPSSVSDSSNSSGLWNEVSIQATVDRWDLSESEIEKLLDLQAKLYDIDHEKNCPSEVVRFLRETHGNVKATEKMFRKFIHWRSEFGVDTILQDYVPDPVLQDYFPMAMLDSYDKDGDGIWYQCFGVTDIYGLVRRYGRHELLMHFIWTMESAIQGDWGKDYDAKMKRAPLATAIIDLQGLSRVHVRPVLLPLYESILDVIQSYYCGFLKRIIFVREPAIFRVMWPVVKHFFNANMHALMVFTASHYKEILPTYFTDLKEDLPSFLIKYGKGKPFKPQRMEGGSLPPASVPYKSLTEMLEESEPPQLVKASMHTLDDVTKFSGLSSLSSSKSSGSASSSSTTSSSSPDAASVPSNCSCPLMYLSLKITSESPSSSLGGSSARYTNDHHVTPSDVRCQRLLGGYF